VTGSGGAARDNGRGKLTMRRNAKQMILTSGNNTVQFDDEAATVVCAVEAVAARSRTARRHHNGMPSRVGLVVLTRALRVKLMLLYRSSCASMRSSLSAFLDGRTELEGKNCVGLVKVKRWKI
jgi:hypothetical protein